MADSGSDFFNEVGGGLKYPRAADQELSCAIIYPRIELEAMERERLISHTISLQHAYAQLESDNSYQAWEAREFKNNLNHLSVIARLATHLNAASIETISEIVLNELPGIFNCSQAAMFLYDADTETLGLHAATESCQLRTPLNRQVNGDHLLFKLFLDRFDPYVAEYLPETGSIAIDGKLENPIPVSSEWLDLFAGWSIIFPLLMKQQDEHEPSPLLLGGIVIGDPKGGIDLNNVDFASIFGNLITSSLYNVLLIKQLREMAIIDPLTKLFNRRHLIDLLNSAITQARRHRHDLSIAMLDIDHFKQCNDVYGHVCGDDVLRQVGERIKLSIRNEVDIPARYGGEEFVIIMPYTNVSRAMIVAERIRGEIGNTSMICGNLAIPITCSMGVAEYDDGESIEQFIDRSDMALYKAKYMGRNRVVSASNTRLNIHQELIAE
ncbi:MAG: GGDEF domain-containing protein [Planctomycetota bacterium]|jgi:diguanylate cyclase (GGDEF)-like protein|nr:GGDEF domain-containing protein [Planctomycetota bacterium]